MAEIVLEILKAGRATAELLLSDAQLIPESEDLMRIAA